MMKDITIKRSMGAGLLAAVVLASGCADQSQNLQSINQSLGEAQRTVDYANSVTQQSAQQRKDALKAAGQQLIQQNPTAQETKKTVDQTKSLINSVKQLGDNVSK